ncbi:hypothetical protein Y032_1006g3371 [Ancylostoma ceylanicum]|nr:hypothetical protein Y032_1006g3371 [Ancylostoma ceylanicum]
MMKIASYDLPKRFGWIMVEGTGTNTDEKLDDAFGQLMEKLKKAKNPPKRYGCFFDDNWPVLNCVYDTKLVLSTYYVIHVMMVEILQDLKLRRSDQLLEVHGNFVVPMTINFS